MSSVFDEATSKRLVKADPTLSTRFRYTIDPAIVRLMLNDHHAASLVSRTALQVDREIMECGDDGQIVALHRVIPCRSPLESPPSIDIPQDLAQEWSNETKRSPIALQKSVKACDTHADRIRTAARAYAGWLHTRPDFLREIHDLKERWNHLVQLEGPPVAISERLASPAAKIQPMADHSEYLADYGELYRKWQLTGMTGPFLPIPVMTHDVVFSTDFSVNWYRADAITISEPMIAPALPAEQWRARIERLSGRRRGPEHLRKWLEVVESANVNRSNQIARYDTLYRIARFWNVIHEEYSPKRGARVLLTAILAEALNISIDLVKKNTKLIMKARREAGL